MTFSQGGRMPSIRLRNFDGSRAVGAYAEWKKEVLVVQKVYNVAQKDLAPLVYLALETGEGKPRELVEMFDLETEICVDDGVDRLFKILDKEFIRPHFERSEEAQKKFDRCRRNANEPIDEYLMRLRTCRRNLQVQDPGTTLSDTA